MKYFKDDLNNVICYQADGSQDDFIPEHLTAITEQEADILRQPPPLSISERKAAKQAEITAIEAKAYMRRSTREKEVASNLKDAIEAGYTHEQMYAANRHYRTIYDEDVLATQLRAEMKAIV